MGIYEKNWTPIYLISKNNIFYKENNKKIVNQTSSSE